MTQTEVSVIIPVHNGAKTVQMAVDSVLRQKIPVQIIVIDDASTDALEEALLRYRELPFFTLLKNEKNMGVAASRMRGVNAAQTEYVAFLDADDWWRDDKLSKQLAVMKAQKAPLSSTGRALVRADGVPTGRVISLPGRVDLKTILRSNCLNCSGVMVRREIMLEFPMEHDDSHEDYISWIKIISKYGFAAGIDEPLLMYRLSEKSKSGNKLKSAVMNFKAYRYCGFNLLQSLGYSVSYIINGIKKYYL